jgi:hypothetical protein
VAYRSQSKRLCGPARWTLLCAVLAPWASGCQSNVQHDLVARELRMQEDQIYAMEDYLAQYQQLVCKYRSENSALRQQLRARDEDTLPAPRPSSGRRDGGGATGGPAIEAPRPGTNGTRPPQDLEVPEVPPLKETTSFDAGGEASLAAGESPEAEGAVQPVSGSEPAPRGRRIESVWLHGEVLENVDGGGPRLLVEVEPLDAAEQSVKFRGALSLMLLAPDAGGAPQSLARWDFAPDEVQSAFDEAAGPMARFQLELPADTPISESTTIWVRLLPNGGEKRLAHAAIDLSGPGQFSSVSPSPRPAEEITATPRQLENATGNDGLSGTAAMETDFNEGGWATATPGNPANLSDAKEESSGQWRASSEPMPVAAARSRPARPKPRIDRTPRKSELPRPVAADVLKPPGWSSDRPDGASPEGPRTATREGRPRWSATR